MTLQLPMLQKKKLYCGAALLNCEAALLRARILETEAKYIRSWQAGTVAKPIQISTARVMLDRPREENAAKEEERGQRETAKVSRGGNGG